MVEPENVNNFSLKIAGAAGDGILNAGLGMFAKTCIRAGLNAFANAEYPSLIRGGHNHLDIKINEKESHSQSKNINILVALNSESVTKHYKKITKGGAIICDEELLEKTIKPIENELTKNEITTYAIPLMKIATECGGKIFRNTVAIGATFALTNFDLELLNTVIKDIFGKKGGDIINDNTKSAKMGYDYLNENYKHDFKYKLKPIEGNHNKILLSGHQATVAGAIQAGCKFLSAYPMTPSTSVMINMASQERNYDLVVKHTEDEIASINMAIGASHAGVRAMTCTSGGGFCLMTEGFGLASVTETPLVVVVSQRPGPGTGMATHTSQGDLKFILSASTDEAPRVIIAPGDVDDAFYYTIQAFDIAEKYQMPVVILTDKYMGESHKSTEFFDTSKIKTERKSMLINKEIKEGYLRYKITDSGISPRAIPGQKNAMYCASSYEHDEEGFEREEEENRIKMHKKRFRKFENLKKELKDPELVGEKDADATIISWGSTKGPVLEALRILEKEGIKTNFLHLVILSPLPIGKIKDVMKNAKKTFIIENNMTAQLASIIKEESCLEFDHKILKYDGRAFDPEHIAEEVKSFLKGNRGE
ncbi:2-oxoacid:acceptor oxidoreductase subunit alpha [Candidatus Aenigmatarchaeota archaeon]